MTAPKFIDKNEPINMSQPSFAGGLASARRSASPRWESEAAELLLRKECQNLLKKRLREPIEKLLLELTGVRLDVIWHQPWHAHNHKSQAPLLCCPAEPTQRNQNRKLPGACTACLEELRKKFAQPSRREHRFVGPCGLTSFCISFNLGNASPLLTLRLQAQHESEDSARDPAAFATAFEHAVALLRLIHQDFEMTLQACMARAAADRLEHRVRILEMENTELRQQVSAGHAERTTAPVHQAADSRKEHLVQEMVAYAHRHFHRPMGLGEVAAALKMNASYLCDIFSRHADVTFHQYLVGLRMAKAKQLLLDPSRQICEVACAVGYASANQFRQAFKAHAGVPPSSWRYARP
jgi:AraC-like DNA-binding protein